LPPIPAPDEPIIAAPDTVRDGAARLPPALSLYLDAWRLASACAVVLCHFGSRRMSGGMMWQATPYGAQAVDVFFVLSGYVIAMAAAREGVPRDFAIRRAARIWSVAVPAACLTFALDAAGRAIFPDAYAWLPGAPDHRAILGQAAAGLLFFNQAWWVIPVGANIPWWSLGYEVPYYVAFGWARFGGAVGRVAGPLAIGLLAGPNVAILSLIWIAGAAVRRCHTRFMPAGRWALVAALAPLPVWLGYEAVCWRVGRPFLHGAGFRSEIPQDVFVGALFAGHLLAAPALLARLPACPPWLAGLIRFGAARSFALYLMHYPVMLLLRAIMLRAVPGASPFWLLPVTLGLCLALAQATELRKGVWRRALERIVPGRPNPGGKTLMPAAP
jgi:peptidoglycan/LPS O-acetylase OafA/YrhL